MPQISLTKEQNNRINEISTAAKYRRRTLYAWLDDNAPPALFGVMSSIDVLDVPYGKRYWACLRTGVVLPHAPFTR